LKNIHLKPEEIFLVYFDFNAKKRSILAHNYKFHISFNNWDDLIVSESRKEEGME
jgi:hypothetical protein